MIHPFSNWICCQLGAREHYAIPRALHEGGQLTHLITDAWVLPHSPLNLLPKHHLANLRERFHPDLSEASVQAFTSSLIFFEMAQRMRRTSGWEQIISRNYWFQKHALKLLNSIPSQSNNPPTLFAYSYAALDLFRYAKTKGWRTVLGQIDPGMTHEKIVMKEYSKYSECQTKWKPAPSYYWKNWHQECLLADQIIVNSSWSSLALQQVDIDSERIKIIPLGYQASNQVNNFERKYPLQFSNQRPLQVLFLGNVVLNKGIIHLLEAAKLLKNQPIEFLIVGSVGITKPLSEEYDKVKWFGAVPRSVTAIYYQKADVFVFPTLSDGFGLTQLEAQAWRLPIIASRYCGEVVKHGVNGLLLPEVTAEAIANSLYFCLKNPQKLESFSINSDKLGKFSLSDLQSSLLSIIS